MFYKYILNYLEVYCIVFFFYIIKMCEECLLLIIYMYIMNFIKIFCIIVLKKKIKIYELCSFVILVI